MVREIILYSKEIAAGSTIRSLWNDDSVFILLKEYKKLKDAYSVRRSSSMPKKGWEAIRNKLHAAGYKDIRTQHVIKKFSALKLHYKEFREGLPVKQKIYGFVDLLAQILDDDPYIEYARPTKRMKEREQIENDTTKPVEHTQNYITLEYADESGEHVTEVINTLDPVQIEGDQLIDASFLLKDNEEEHQQGKDTNKANKMKKVKPVKDAKVDEDEPEMPSWINYLVSLLRKEEQLRGDQLWTLHESICQAERVKLDILDRLIHCLKKPDKVVLNKRGNARPEIVTKSRLIIPESPTSNSRNIIIVDEEGSIYLKPTDLLKRKRNSSEYVLSESPHKIIKTQQEIEFIESDGETIGVPQLQLQLIGEGDEIIIENCDESEIYKVEPVYHEELDESNVISHVEIVEEHCEAVQHHQIDTIEFIQTVSSQHH